MTYIPGSLSTAEDIISSDTALMQGAQLPFSFNRETECPFPSGKDTMDPENLSQIPVSVTAEICWEHDINPQ